MIQNALKKNAAVVELADARDSKSRGSDTVSVRPRPAAPYKKNGIYSRSFYILLFWRGVRGDLSPSFVNLPLRQIPAEGIPLLRETAVPKSCRPAAPYKKNGIYSRSFYILLFWRGVRGDLSPSFVNLPLRQIPAEGIPLLRETAVPESCRPAAPYKKNGICSRSFYILLRCQPRLKREA